MRYSSAGSTPTCDNAGPKIWSACSMPNANVLELEKIRTERARQKLLEQELERRERELIDANAVDQYMAEVERNLRAHWATWPARMAPKRSASGAPCSATPVVAT